MKIFFSITYYDPYVSGLSICTKRLAELLHKRGHTVQVLCMRHEKHIPLQEVIQGVNVTRAIPLFPFHKGFFSFEFFGHAYRFIRNSDVVVIHLPQAEGWVAALIGHLLGKRIVSVYHCEPVLPKGFFNSIIQTFLEISTTVSFVLSDTIVSYTKEYAYHSKLLRPFLKKTSFIYPPVPKPVVNKTVRQRLSRIIKTHTIVVGVAARLAAEKGIEYLIEALPFLPKDTVIVIAGPMEPVGEQAYKETILSLVSRYAHQVIFLGTLTQKEMGAFYSLLHVLVLPSVNSTEAFGLVQVEAMLCGTPVVASNLPGVRIPVRKTDMGKIVPIQNSRSLAAAIRDIMKHPDAFYMDSSAIQTLFSLPTTIDSYEHILSA